MVDAEYNQKNWPPRYNWNIVESGFKTAILLNTWSIKTFESEANQLKWTFHIINSQRYCQINKHIEKILKTILEPL